MIGRDRGWPVSVSGLCPRWRDIHPCRAGSWIRLLTLRFKGSRIVSPRDLGSGPDRSGDPDASAHTRERQRKPGAIPVTSVEVV